MRGGTSESASPPSPFPHRLQPRKAGRRPAPWMAHRGRPLPTALYAFYVDSEGHGASIVAKMMGIDKQLKGERGVWV